ncbi:MAG: hypothetical protein II992_05085 [Lachnospiraceae bacterium]|nr:hypothetical protein [Lachnospiraceae bacterium]
MPEELKKLLILHLRLDDLEEGTEETEETNTLLEFYYSVAYEFACGAIDNFESKADTAKGRILLLQLIQNLYDNRMLITDKKNEKLNILMTSVIRQMQFDDLLEGS